MNKQYNASPYLICTPQEGCKYQNISKTNKNGFSVKGLFRHIKTCGTVGTIGNTHRQKHATHGRNLKRGDIREVQLTCRKIMYSYEFICVSIYIFMYSYEYK